MGQNEHVECKLLEKYPPIFSPATYQKKPLTVQDNNGNLMLWYIPGSLTIERVVSFFPLVFFVLPRCYRGRLDANLGGPENTSKIASDK